MHGRQGYTGAGSTFDAKKGWSSSGKLIVAETSKSVSLQAAFPEADVYTIQFSLDPPKSLIFRAVATIVWTVEGNQISRMVDVANGVTVSSPSQAVKVIVNDLTKTGSGGVAGEEYGVTISVVRGTRAYTGVPATLKAADINGTVLEEILLASGSTTFPIPQGAGVVSVSVAAFSAAAGGVKLLISQNNTASNVKIYGYTDQGVGPNFIAVSPLATFIGLSNTDNANPVSVSTTWGIDG